MAGGNEGGGHGDGGTISAGKEEGGGSDEAELGCPGDERNGAAGLSHIITQHFCLVTWETLGVMVPDGSWCEP